MSMAAGWQVRRAQTATDPTAPDSASLVAIDVSTSGFAPQTSGLLDDRRASGDSFAQSVDGTQSPPRSVEDESRAERRGTCNVDASLPAHPRRHEPPSRCPQRCDT